MELVILIRKLVLLALLRSNWDTIYFISFYDLSFIISINSHFTIQKARKYSFALIYLHVITVSYNAKWLNLFVFLLIL